MNRPEPHKPGRPRLLMLNPPAPRTVIRDYYCSKTSRSNYLFPPVDLVMQSGILAARYELAFIDAIRDRLDEGTTLKRIEAFAPEAVFALAGAVNHPADLEFLSEVASRGRKMVVSGDVFLEEPTQMLEKHRWIDAIALDFTNSDILNYLTKQTGSLERMVFRGESGKPVEGTSPRPSPRIEIPTPRHELFLDRRYRFPFARHRSFSVILTDFGCPYPCRFCVMASLPYRTRPNPSIIEELEHLGSLGVRELFFMNQTFGVKRAQTLELLENMKGRFSQAFSWTAFGRPDLCDVELVTAMKQAGCHTLIMGVENGSNAILERYRKGYRTDQVEAAFRLCRSHGIRTVGTFILGLPGENEQTIQETIRFSRKIDPDFVSFHAAVPRSATELRSEAVAANAIDRHDHAMDQSGSFFALTPQGMDQPTLKRYLRRAVLGFYLRPFYLLRRIFSLKGLFETLNMIYQGIFLIWTLVVPEKRLRQVGKG